MSGDNRPSLLAILIIVFFQQIIMGGTFPVARYVLVQTDPLVVAFFRYIISSAILCLIACFIGKRPNARPIEKKDYWKIVSLGLVIIILNQTTFLIGQKFTTSAHGALLFSMTPIFVYLLAMKYLSEKWSIKKGLGIFLAVSGSMVIVFEKGLEFDFNILTGDLIIILAVIAWAVYTVFGKPLVQKYGALRMTAYTIGVGTLFYFPFGLYRTFQTDLTVIDGLGWMAILYISILTSVIGYIIWYWLLHYMEASQVSVLVNIQPISAGIIGFYLLSEEITIPFVVGGLIILSGIMIMQLVKTKTPR